MNDSAVRQLSEAIIEQAVEDYRELRQKGVVAISHKDEGDYALDEIEAFFRGGWCKRLLNTIPSRIDGVTILRHLKSENHSTYLI